MAMFYEKPKPRGYSLIAAELDGAKALLKDRSADLEKAKRHVRELESAIESLAEKVAGLEHDQRALDRGYIALMGDSRPPVAS